MIRTPVIAGMRNGELLQQSKALDESTRYGTTREVRPHACRRHAVPSAQAAAPSTGSSRPRPTTMSSSRCTKDSSRRHSSRRDLAVHLGAISARSRRASRRASRRDLGAGRRAATWRCGRWAPLPGALPYVLTCSLAHSLTLPGAPGLPRAAADASRRRTAPPRRDVPRTGHPRVPTTWAPRVIHVYSPCGLHVSSTCHVSSHAGS